MRAALLQAAGQPFELVDDVEIDDPKTGEVRVRVSHCGVCHSDLSIADGVVPRADADRARARSGRRRRRRGPGS